MPRGLLFRFPQNSISSISHITYNSFGIPQIDRIDRRTCVQSARKQRLACSGVLLLIRIAYMCDCTIAHGIFSRTISEWNFPFKTNRFDCWHKAHAIQLVSSDSFVITEMQANGCEEPLRSVIEINK